MSIPQKDRFEKHNLNAAVISSRVIPENFFYEEEEYYVLGSSSDTDMVPRADQEAVQMICVNRFGDFYDAALLVRNDGFVYLRGFRTRPAPDKPRKPRETDNDDD